jgi:methylated-DNA-[protein]-cysteine S-methyltransferase
MVRWLSITGTPGAALRVETSGHTVTGIAFEDAPAEVPVPDQDPLLDRAEAQLREYFAGRRQAFDLPIDAGGTEFQRRVWTAVCGIPFGETRTYAEIARAVGSPRAVRAVGAANGSNPVPILIPCHRVVATGGGLGGYGGGLARKRWLLDLESGVSARAGHKVQQARLVFDLDSDLQVEQP